MSALLGLAAIVALRSLDAAATALARRTGLRPGDYLEVHAAPWRITRREGNDLYDLRLAALPGAGSYARSVHEPRRYGRLVVACDFAPDGSGMTYILDARDEYLDDPAPTCAKCGRPMHCVETCCSTWDNDRGQSHRTCDGTPSAT